MAITTVDASSAAEQANASALSGYVRKSELAEILVTDWHHPTSSEQAVTLRWPRTHPFYTVHEHSYSPLLFSESMRQALALVSHTAFDIPLDHRLGWEYLRSAVNPAALRHTGSPAVVELRLVHTAVNRRKLGSVYLTVQVEASRDGMHLGTAELRYSTHPPVIYNRLRANYADAQRAFARALPPVPPMSPGEVGRSAADDVVLAASGDPRRWRLRVDTAHPVLFDHPHDHLPGMVLLEAAGQAAQACASPQRVVATGFDTTFFRYVELDRPCWISALPGEPDALGRSRVHVEGHQANQPVFSCLVTTEPAEGM
ncbi:MULTISPECIES: ScbA/BarX family gamma-butyrolactone biosynthesis protein [unclassified Streptomyces]|uniref:ScbA/BarX family gamma-butyrolactone biosynthesis protein n=1 Tax=unclassified Streptomyces TaxID=2593676 RepID=UPI0037FFC702